MAITHVQLQRGPLMAKFMDKYGMQKKCPAALVASHGPTGLRCPCCVGTSDTALSSVRASRSCRYAYRPATRVNDQNG